MDSATWCRTPAAASAGKRLRPEVSKNSSTALSSNEGELARSITTCVPVMASLRPWPLMVLTPVLGEAATTSWPLWRRMGAVFEPIRPVPPMTTIFMFRFLSSIGSECSLRHRQPCARLFGRIQNSGSTRETTGRRMELTRFLERHTTIGGVGCRGQELSRILSLPMGERPEAACEGTLKRGCLPVKETHRLAAMGRARPLHEGDPALRALAGWVAHRVAIPSGGADAIFRRCGISRTHRGPSGRPLGERTRYRAVAPRLGCSFSDRLGHRRGAPSFSSRVLSSRWYRGPSEDCPIVRRGM